MKMNRFLAALFFLTLILNLQAQETVFLESTEKGRGLLKARSGECFVITPEHVVSEAISIISVIGSKNVLSQGKLVQAMDGVDLAIVRIVGGGTQNCNNWSVPHNYSTILDNTIDGYIELRGETGSIQLMQVYINGKDEEFISIKPKNSNEHFMKGMSGGSLFTQYEGKKVYLGMLQEIGEDGEGYVYQADDIERILGGFFGESTKPASVTSMTTKQVAPSDISVEEEGYRFDLIEVKKSNDKVVCKLKVTSLEKDGELRIYGAYGANGSVIYDQNGNVTYANRVQLGSSSGNAWTGDGYSLIEGIPVPLELTFEGVDESADGMSLFIVKTYDFKVRFKNISFGNLASELEVPVIENVQHSKEEEGYRFDLISVYKTGTTVKCSFRVTSLEKDGELRIYGSYGFSGSMIYDQNGKVTHAENVKLGSLSGKAWIGDDYTLVKGIPVPVELTFKNVDDNAVGMSLLTLKTYNFAVRFKNIRFSDMTSDIEVPVFDNVTHSTEEEGYRFDLIKVKKSGTTVKCNIRVTSLDKDGELRLYGGNGTYGTKIYDQNGVESPAASIKLGGMSGNAWIGDDYTLVKGIPVPLELTFKDVDDAAIGMSMLLIKTYGFDVRFKNIAF